MRIALDIDSTLHHYWDTLSEAARCRFGIELPYEEQFDWGITRLKPKQLEVVIADTHSDEAILAGTPYPGAVETVRAWHEAGHFIHVTSHRAGGCHAGDRAVAGADRPAVRRPALLLRQGQPLRRARDRPAGRRQPGQHPPGDRAGHHRRDARPPVEPGRVRRGPVDLRRDWAELERKLRPWLSPASRVA